MTSRSLCAIEMEAFMLAAKDSETCIRRSNLVNNLKPRKNKILFFGCIRNKKTAAKQILQFHRQNIHI